VATWDDVLTYVRRNYTIQEEIRNDDGAVMGLRMVFSLSDLRSQLVFLWHNKLGDGTESWVQITSPFAKAAEVNLSEVLDVVGGYVCGGVAKYDELLILQHAAPLLNLDINELERPLQLVLSTADNLERRFAGGDAF
jgi:hypothetical protein